jgi:hypothetical protein
VEAIGVTFIKSDVEYGFGCDAVAECDRVVLHDIHEDFSFENPSDFVSPKDQPLSRLYFRGRFFYSEVNSMSLGLGLGSKMVEKVDFLKLDSNGYINFLPVEQPVPEPIDSTETI